MILPKIVFILYHIHQAVKMKMSLEMCRLGLNMVGMVPYGKLPVYSVRHVVIEGMVGPYSELIAVGNYFMFRLYCVYC